MQLTVHQKKNLSDFFINIASGWYVAVFITPFITQGFDSSYFIKIFIVGIINAAGFLYLSWWVYNK
ncbi:MAG: hypothetical protein ACD_19C00140G0024 [uncultured bacterium]|nr:MAG: hypothetical protein ACD_19C00140G0024 [uncultured bacterium]